ncbi:Asp-tRNA(Asn)/Glu-tRNA(Gln) amidotransferase subunit GatA [Paludisphaera mucosa]|uniref:Glutamyl-tRNA(Gln) amidotransferase subunit A n=1 Tax=Paludisphaera mucosa TaxID=3030827 RepID=A0ABT6F5A3_9BACT|nr:Asp-tRNA(Asn)/Glu-tRNA(Gln) amidotransferase subunit GatA [Paludisphaera mucosa]MDG3002699.1 Asp-tRNA(Asn)/Glu-tRNA(Gln) amidotransferase subunit GatA [Paludisphaera mucosa]
MNADLLKDATATALLAMLNAGEVTSEELVRGYLDRADALKRLNVFVHLDPENVLDQARAVDAKRKAGEAVGPLAGVPVAIKDVLCVEKEPTTCGSRMLKDFRPPYDATVIVKLRQAGAILFGKTNMDEFAMGSSTENSAYGPTLNPWDEARVPGGSSGGSAAAVAADLAPLSLGSDTGGSIRQPAAVCGVVGIKPTYGRVSRYGLIAFASSLDQIGPFTHDLADAALLLKVISGRDERDATSVDQPVPDYSATLDEKPRSLRIGVAREFFGEGLDPEVESAVREAMRVYEQAGATLKEVSLPNSKYGVPAYYIVAPAECSSNLARYDGTIFGHRAEDWSPKHPGEEDLHPLVRMMMASRAEGFGAEVKRRIMLGTFALSAGYADQYYNQALKVRRLIRNDFDAAFKDVDVILGPTSPSPAFKLGERTADPLAMYLSDIYTITANLAGIPGLSVPCGLTRSGLPIGLQLLAPAFAEENLLRTARVFERATDWHRKRPGLS